MDITYVVSFKSSNGAFGQFFNFKAINFYLSEKGKASITVLGNIFYNIN